jgi:hypothetical protein
VWKSKTLRCFPDNLLGNHKTLSTATHRAGGGSCNAVQKEKGFRFVFCPSTDPDSNWPKSHFCE